MSACHSGPALAQALGGTEPAGGPHVYAEPAEAWEDVAFCPAMSVSSPGV